MGAQDSRGAPLFSNKRRPARLNSERGAHGWSISLGAENLRIVSITTAGTDVLADAHTWSEVVEPGLDTGSGPQGEGAVSVVMLWVGPGTNCGAGLPPEGTARIARITLEAVIPEAPSQARLFFIDGKQGAGQPVPNVVTLEFASHFPALGSCSIDLKPVRPGGLQLPGDANQDGGLDLSDAVWLLGHLFLGTFAALPCEGGTASDPGPGDLSLLDSNGDGGLDLSDAVRALQFLFGGSAPPVLGTECVRIPGCSDACKS